MLDTMGDGRTSLSPYDTAWIALVRNLHGLDLPQFPSSLQWTANNQLLDGSWGDEHFFLAYDRLLNTLACLVAMKSWKVHAQKIQKEGWQFNLDALIPWGAVLNEAENLLLIEKFGWCRSKSTRLGSGTLFPAPD
ncbi:Ent-copalyl diphosphate synthase [Abeliophyllum distichum]|uniref:Ent-copalyl diphosphate synthase n=1 Tax=Abeliophyllum distichum TaxID=126358 RepID=A0ABD1QY68_9LAMI